LPKHFLKQVAVAGAGRKGDGGLWTLQSPQTDRLFSEEGMRGAAPADGVAFCAECQIKQLPLCALIFGFLFFYI